MSDRIRSRLGHSIFGAAAALLVGAGLTAPSHAAGTVDAALKAARAGQCRNVGGANPGRICIVRENINNPSYVHFRLVFTGSRGATHFNEQQLQSQSQIRANQVDGTSGVIFRHATPGHFVQVKVQACVFVTFGSDCSDWAVLRILK
jgi:hypothetical protein